MNGEYSVCISFSEIIFKFVFPEKIELPHEFEEFLCENTDRYDEKITVSLLDSPLLCNERSLTAGNTKVYAKKDGLLYVYSELTTKDGCRVAFFCADNRENILYYPSSMWSFFSSPFNCLHLICGERLLLRNGAFLLHSSVVKYKEKCFLFCGPSGIGKSTQAALWQKYCGATVINGDRCIIRKINGKFHGGGSFWCGTSGIYHKDYLPIEGVFFLDKSEENIIEKLGAEAFALILSNTIVNSYDKSFMEKIVDIIEDFFACVPIYKLSCRPDESAVETVLNTVYDREENEDE